MSRYSFISAKSRRRLFVYSLSVLPAFTFAKVAGLQLSDIVLLYVSCHCIWSIFQSNFVFRVYAGIAYFIRSYCLLMILLALTAAFAMTQTFYPLYDVSFLFQPGLRSLAKLTQLASVLCGFLWLANALSKDRALLLKALNLYWWTGVIGAVYTILWYLLSRLTGVCPDSLVVAVYSPDGVFIRARGFFNEGGPYGVYLVSVCTVGVLRQEVTGKRIGWSSIALAVAFLMSASKAGFLMAALLLAYWIMSTASLRKKVLGFSFAIIVGFSTASYLHIGKLLSDYVDSYEKLGANAAYFGRDPNVVIGRVAASYIVPRMLAARPLTGVGFGNYPITRNDPNYLGSLPSMMDAEDIPGAGIPGIAAEVGIPITVWIMVLLFVPFMRTRKRSAMAGMVALVQPLAHVFGLQLTFFYPWFTAACAIAATNFSTALSDETNYSLRHKVGQSPRDIEA